MSNSINNKFNSDGIQQLNPINASTSNFTEGYILSYSYPTNSYLVSVEGGLATLNCIYTGTVLSRLIGLKFNTILEPGTKVLVLKNLNTNNNYIIGVIPSGGSSSELSFSNYVGMNNDTSIGKFDAFSDEFELSKNNECLLDGSQPSDLAYGETSISNGSGVALNLLHSLASLQGSDLSRVECHILDDMVRILSNTYSNINAFGEYTIFNENGGLNVVWNGTSNSHESFGLDSKAEALCDLEGKDKLKTDTDAKDLFYQDGRWRFSQYIGKIGNFIHTFITDPKNTLVKNTSASDEDSGKPLKAGRFSFHVNEDGSVLCQSVSDIVLEKVIKIPVPTEKDRWEESKGGIVEEHLKAYEGWNPLSDESIWETVYKLNDYSKWFSNYYSKAGFWSNPRFNPPIEANTPNLDPYCNDETRKQQDKNAASTLEKSQVGYSTIRIFKDGSIILKDAYGSAINMSGGNITISAANNLILTAANNVDITGKFIHNQGVHGIANASSKGGIENDSKYFNRAYVSNGPIHIESNWNIENTVMSGDDEVPDIISSTYENYVSSLKSNDGNNISSILLKSNSSGGDITLSSAQGNINIISKLGAIVTSSFHTIINSIKSFNIENVIQYVNGKLGIFKPTQVTRNLEVAGQISTGSKVPIRAKMENPDSAVKYKEDLRDNPLSYSTSTYEDNISKESIGIDSSEYVALPFTNESDLFIPYMQSLTDQNLPISDNDSNSEFIKFEADKLKIDTNKDFIYPYSNKQMKIYTPQNTTTKDVEASEISKYEEFETKPYAVVIKK